MAAMKQEIRRLIRYRDFLYFLIVLDIKRRYRQTVAGLFWIVFQPLALALVFVVLFSDWYGQGGESETPYLSFTYTGLVVWTFFNRALSVGTPRLVHYASLVRKINFPREMLPAAAVGTAVFDMALTMVALVAINFHFGVSWFPQLVWFPAVLLLQVVFTFGLTLLLAGVNVYYRDVQYVLPFFLQLWFFVTPIIYRADQIPELFRPLFYVNPLVGVVELYRWMFLGIPYDLRSVMFSIVSTFAVMVVAYVAFRRMEKRFADVI